jgi:hypothetical protein
MKSPRYGSGIIAVWPVGKETSWSYETTRLLAMPPLKIFHEANQLLNCRECKPVVERSANAAGGAMPGESGESGSSYFRASQF